MVNIDLVDVSVMGDKEDNDEEDDDDDDEAIDGRGRRNVEEKYPDLVPFINDLLRGRGENEAERRRSDERFSSVGITLREMSMEAKRANMNVGYAAIGGLLMGPRKTGKRHKCIIKARPIRRSNSYRVHHVRGHWACAKIRYRVEFAATTDGIDVFSADDMSKKPILKNCVSHKTTNHGYSTSQHARSTGLNHIDDMPSNFDHDFPVAERMLITTSGYLHMDKGTGQLEKDKAHRERYSKPGATKLYVTLRAFRYGGPSARDHVDDFYMMVRSKMSKPLVGAVIIVDNGPDFNINRALVQHLWVEVWKKLTWACLSVVSNVAGWSSVNPIETMWGPMTKAVGNTVLGRSADGDISEGEDYFRRAFRLALRQLQDIWGGAMWLSLLM